MTELSLPSVRDGKKFGVPPLRFGGIRAMIRAEKQGADEVAAVMILETLKLSFENVTMDEVDDIEQADFLKLIPLIEMANKGISDADFQSLPAMSK